MDRSSLPPVSRLAGVVVLLGLLVAPARADHVIPLAADGATVYSGTAGLCLLCSVSDEDRVIDGDLANFATLTIPVGVAGSAYLGVTFPEPVALDGRWQAGFLVENASGLLGAQLLEQLALQTYLGGELQQTAGGIDLLRLDAIEAGLGYVTLTANRPFDEVRISVGGAATLLTSLRIYHAGARSLPQYETEVSFALASQGAEAYGGTAGLCVGCAVTAVEHVIDGDLATYATISLPLGVGGSSHVSVTVPRPVPGGRAVGFLVADASGLPGAQLLGQLTLRTYLGGALQETATSDNGLLQLSQLQGQRGAVRFFARAPFDEVRLEVDGAALVLTTLRVHAAGTATRVRVDRQAGDGFTGEAEDDALVAAFAALLEGERAAAPPAGALGAGVVLGDPHPNPAASSATLPLSVDAPQHVRVAAYDATGRRVAVLHDGALAEGAHTLRFEGASLPAGVYLIRVEGEAFGLTRRLLLVR